MANSRRQAQTTDVASLLIEFEHGRRQRTPPAGTWKLLMEPGNQNRFTENMAVHCVDHSHTRIGGLLRRTLRHIELGVERIKFECVEMVWTGRRTWIHIAIRAQAHLTAAIGQFPGHNALRQACRRPRNIPDPPMSNIHLRALPDYRLGIMQKANETLRPQEFGLKAPGGFEPTQKAVRAFPFPLGYGAISSFIARP